MAIYSKLPGITITVRVNGKDLKEYPAPNELPECERKRVQLHLKEVTSTHYIGVNSGDTFEIYLSVEAPYKMDCPILGFRVFVDGDWIQEPILSREVYEKDGKWSDLVSGPAVEVDGKLAYRSMVFKAVAVSKSFLYPHVSAEFNIFKAEIQLPKAVIEEHVEKMQGVGEIIVELHRLKNAKRSQRSKDEKSMEWDKKYNKEVHLKSVVQQGISEGAM
jgi:hypothetical protein